MKKLNLILVVAFLFNIINASAQLADSCKLVFGTNISGLSDYGTELPFVNMMKNCREWYSKDVNNPDGSPFNSESVDSMSFRADGYPTHSPQTIANRAFTQNVATIWAITDGWAAGKYVVLFDGEGELSFWGGLSNLTLTSANRYTFDFDNPIGNALEMTIVSSSSSNPVRNIRIMKSEFENTYQTNPFNPVWINKLLIFKSIRFMDWGATNNWGQSDPWTWDSPELFDWSDRQQMDNYTWATAKGVPYEMMIKLLNDYNIDGWVCVPHRASNDYIQNMAQLFHEQLKPELNLTVEYSNELWNWMFGQANWCFNYGCTVPNVSWPEGIVPYIQNCMDVWTSVYQKDLSRLSRVVGVQTGWLDVSQRIVNTVRPGSIDVVAPAFYFGLSSESLEAELDALGANATVADVASRVRQSSNENEKVWMQQIKTQVADPLNLPIVFYEGGQHITPNPFGETPTYEQALLDIQRDTSMYNLYNEWFDFLRTLQVGNKPLKCMNFSFIAQRSAKYGSWGILETMAQDTSVIPAPKYKAIIENMNSDCFKITAVDDIEINNNFMVYPNPACEYIIVKALDTEKIRNAKLTDITGKVIYQIDNPNSPIRVEMSNYSKALYLLTIETTSGSIKTFKVMKN